MMMHVVAAAIAVVGFLMAVGAAIAIVAVIVACILHGASVVLHALF